MTIEDVDALHRRRLGSRNRRPFERDIVGIDFGSCGKEHLRVVPNDDRARSTSPMRWKRCTGGWLGKTGQGSTKREGSGERENSDLDEHTMETGRGRKLDSARSKMGDHRRYSARLRMLSRRLWRGEGD